MLNLIVSEEQARTMVSPALIGLIGVVLGAVISEVGAIARTKSQEGAADTRTQAEFYLDRKVDALTNLYSQLEETHRTLNDNMGLDPEDEEKYWEEVQPKVSEFRNAVRRDGIFLSKEQDELLHEALGQFRQASIHIQAQVEGRNRAPDHLNLKEFTDTYDDARSALKEELNRPIRELED
jgi:hypothetical protein